VKFVDREAAVIELARGRRVLHLGCVGHTDVSTASRIEMARDNLHGRLTAVTEVVGVDLSADVINAWRESGVFDNVLVGDVEELGALDLDGPFEVIVAGDIIEHLSNPGRMLRGIRSLAGPDTMVVITTPHSFGLPNYLRFLLGRFHEGLDHVASYNSANIEHLLRRYGMRIERLDTCHQSRIAASNSLTFRIGRSMLRRFPKLAGTLLVVARVDGSAI
jgi:2-polyprenyl-3-methyl-5-hydroxy-6-metoxy-1,4-benzoquinol methylase